MAPDKDAEDEQVRVVGDSEPAAETSPRDAVERLALYRYVTAENAAEYL